MNDIYDYDVAKKQIVRKKPVSDKELKDINEVAASIVKAAIGLSVEHKQPNPAAQELGRLGGLKGGKARAEKLTSKQRIEIAKKAAAKRWHK